MSGTLCEGTVLELLEPFTYRVRLADGRAVEVQPSRLHFGNRLADLEHLQSLRPDTPVTVRVNGAAPSQGWLVRVARTAEEWHSSTDPALLLETVRDEADERTLRRFACTCCRVIADLLPEGPHRQLLGRLEAYAEGKVAAAELETARVAGEAEKEHLAERAEETESDPIQGPEAAARVKAVCAVRIAALVPKHSDCFEIVLDAVRACSEAAGLSAKARAEGLLDAQARGEELACRAQADLIRQIIANPFV